MQRKCCRHRGKQWPRPFKTTRPLLPPPEPRRPSTASALPNWGQPLSDCTIFFAAHPRAEMSAHSAACRESGPCLSIPPSGSRSPGVSEVNGARVGEGGWVALLPLPVSSSSRGDSGASRTRRVRGGGCLGCARGAREIAWPGCGRPRKPLPRSLARAPGAAALAKTHRREHGARSQKLVMSSVQREPHLLFF